jgi:hypothetical protein
LKKEELYDNIPMDVVDGGIKYVQEINQRVYTGGGAKFGNGDTIFCNNYNVLGELKNCKS